MELFNSSTLNFTTPNPSTNLILSPLLVGFVHFVQSFYFIVGFFLNSYSIWIIVRGTSSGLALEFFNLNLSVFENVLCLNSLFGMLFLRFPNLAGVSLFLSGVGLTGRPLFQCLMCVERYLAVVHPVTFLKYKPLRYRLICSIAAWFISLGFCLLYMLFIVSLSEAKIIWFYVLHFLLFFSIQLFCLVAVLRALKQSGPGERNGEENHMKRRAFHLILITTVSVSLIYVPTATVGIIRVSTANNIVGLWVCSQLSFMLAGLVQPVLFLHRCGKLSCVTLKRHCG